MSKVFLVVFSSRRAIALCPWRDHVARNVDTMVKIHAIMRQDARLLLLGLGVGRFSIHDLSLHFFETSAIYVPITTTIIYQIFDDGISEEYRPLKSKEIPSYSVRR